MNTNEFNEKPQMPENDNSPASAAGNPVADDNMSGANLAENAEDRNDLPDSNQQEQVPVKKHEPVESSDEEQSSDDIDDSSEFSEQGELLPPVQSPYEEDETDEDMVDYSALSKDQLTSELERLLNDFEVQKIRKRVEVIKSQFYKKHQKDVAKQKEQFAVENGEDAEFQQQPDPVNDTFNKLMQLYKEKRSQYLDRIEEQKQGNLQKRLGIIEGIKNLINQEESLDKTFEDFRSFQEQWRNAGKVDQNLMKDIWEKYHFAVEQFYDFVKINKELRDLDLKRNLEAKQQLCEAAEKLLLDEAVVKSFRTLQEYHQKWREIGPVPREQREQIWERFKNATIAINKRHQDFFENLKKEQQNNLEAKETLCKRIEEINKLNLVKSKKWEDKSSEIIEIQKLWKAIGFAPKKYNSEVYSRFKAACDEFFNTKRAFFAEKHEEEQKNLDAKIKLCEKAEELKESTDWKETSGQFIKLQKEWKQIGPVPRRSSDPIWKRFRAACDYFFDAKKIFYSTADKRQEENLAKKIELIEAVKNWQLTDNDEVDLKALSDFQKDWSEIGFVPFDKKEEIQKDFRQAINKHFDSMKIEDEKRNVMNFSNKIDNWLDNPRLKKKVGAERNKLVNTIKDLENEITLYENNMGFFSSSKKSNVLIEEIKNKIERAKKRISLLRQKLNILDGLDN